jgi:SAM-dependent methyltransferase
MTRSPNFDRIARPYRWLEYLTLARSLERCRFHFLPQLGDSTHALVLGDGDGRFLARLMAANPHLKADAVDLSATMLTLLRNRCAPATSSTRLQTHQADALAFVHAHSPVEKYDLVVTHFFLDCLTQPQLDALATSIASQLTPNALWLVSDFRIPSGPMRLPARLLVRGLYLAFRVLTGLRSTQLPDHASSLMLAGLTRIALHHSLLGLLTTELWSNSSSTPTSFR